MVSLSNDNLPHREVISQFKQKINKCINTIPIYDRLLAMISVYEFILSKDGVRLMAKNNAFKNSVLKSIDNNRPSVEKLLRKNMNINSEFTDKCIYIKQLFENIISIVYKNWN